MLFISFRSMSTYVNICVFLSRKLQQHALFIDTLLYMDTNLLLGLMRNNTKVFSSYTVKIMFD